jgi:5S rRNA maturation endonuclease (ribonuclease M5)
MAIIVAEGESDYLSLCQRYPGHPVLGVFSGSWCAEWAARIPPYSEVTIRTDNDDAGERYAREISKSLKDRAVVRRAS